MKIVINDIHGGFSLSKEAAERYIELKGLTLYAPPAWPETYYLVPVEEFNRVHKNDLIKTEWAGKSGGIGRYADSNSLIWNQRNIARNDPILIQVVEEMGDAANGRFAHLRVVEIPDDVQWKIQENDGLEWVAEKHRTWE
jgi:hypothetical protein